MSNSAEQQYLTRQSYYLPTDDELELIRPCLDSYYRELPNDQLRVIVAEQLGHLTPLEVEGFWNSLRSVNWGRVLGGAASGAASGAAAGTAVTPGYGTAIGAGLGALVGGIGSALGGSGSRRPSQPARQPAARSRTPSPAARQPARRPPAAAPVRRPVRQLPSRVPAGGSGASAVAGTAINGLMQILQNPQVTRALTSLIMGSAGQRDLTLADGTHVSHKSVLNAIKVYADLAAREASGIGMDTADYLLDEFGNYRVDPSDDEARAGLMYEKLLADSALQIEAALNALNDAEIRDIIEPLSRTLSSRARFQAGVSNTTVFPHSAICHLSIQMDSGTGIGTGFYIAPNRIMTAGHNVYHRRYGRARSMLITPGKNGSSSPFGSFRIGRAQMVAHPDWKRDPSRADFDIAVIKTTSPPSNNRYFALEELRFTPVSGVAVCGYAARRSAGVDPNEQNMDYDTIRDLNAETFTYSLNTTGGTSGSPVFYVSGGAIKAVGVHSRAHDRHTNMGCRLTDTKITWINGVRDDVFENEGESPIEEHDFYDAPVVDMAGAFDAQFEAHDVSEAAVLDELESLGAFDMLDSY